MRAAIIMSATPTSKRATPMPCTAGRPAHRRVPLARPRRFRRVPRQGHRRAVRAGRLSGATATDLHREGVALEPSPTKPTEPRLGTERAWRWIQSPTKANLTDVAVISPPSRHRGAQAAVGDDGQPRIPGGARHAHPRGGPARAPGVPTRPPLHAALTTRAAFHVELPWPGLATRACTSSHRPPAMMS